MSARPVCSVIVPSYRSETTIEACLSALHQQDFNLPFEIIVVDSSPDSTPRLIQASFPGVHLVHLEQQTGPALARNTGARLAGADMLAFIDSDCIAESDWLGRLYDLLQAGWQAAGGAILPVDPDNPISLAGYFLEFREFLPIGSGRQSNNLTLGNAAYQRDAFWRADGFPDGYFPQEDQVFHSAFTAAGGRIYFDPGIRVWHHQRTNAAEFLRHQYRIGTANARVVHRLRLPGCDLTRRPRLARLAVPALAALRLVRTIYASWPASRLGWIRQPAMFWWAARGMLRWAQGFAASAQYLNMQEDHSSGEDFPATASLTRSPIPPISKSGSQPVSIIVCTRDRPQLLQTCLEALTQLAEAGHEVIIVDNAPSTDAAATLVQKYPYRYILEPVPGLNRARNRGLALASHPLVVFTDDDCLPQPRWASELAEAFTQASVAAVTGLVLPFELDNPAQQAFEDYCANRRIFTPQLFQAPSTHPAAAGKVGMGANMAFRREVLEQIGGFDPRFDGGTPTLAGGDTEMFARLLAGGWQISYTPAARVLHRHPSRRKQVRRVIYGYGVGLYAFLAKRWFEDHDRSVPVVALRWLLGPLLKAVRNRLLRKPAAAWDLVWCEFLGGLVGPVIYWRSVRGHDETDLAAQQPEPSPRAAGRQPG